MVAFLSMFNDFPLWYNYKNLPWTLKMASHAMEQKYG